MFSVLLYDKLHIKESIGCTVYGKINSRMHGMVKGNIGCTVYGKINSRMHGKVKGNIGCTVYGKINSMMHSVVYLIFYHHITLLVFVV